MDNSLWLEEANVLFLRLQRLETLFSPYSETSKIRTPSRPGDRVPVCRPPHEAAVAMNATASSQLPKYYLIFTTWPSQKEDVPRVAGPLGGLWIRVRSHKLVYSSAMKRLNVKGNSVVCHAWCLHRGLLT